MPYQSFWCLKGRDNGQRFLLISLSCYLLLLLAIPMFERAPLLFWLVQALALFLLSTSALRRLRDAAAPLWLAPIVPVVFLLTILGLLFAESAWRYLVLILPLLTTLGGTFIANPNRRVVGSYLWGYNGPANNMENGEKATRWQRIEPTLAGETPPEELELHGRLVDTRHGNAEQIDDRIQFSLSLPVARPTLMVIAALLVLIFVAIAWHNWPSSQNQLAEEKTLSKNNVAEFTKERRSKIELPDSFWIMLDQNRALTIAWQGDTAADGEYWSAYTGKGDPTCAEIDFTVGGEYRVLRVEVKNGGDYYADFSPLDTDALVRDIALKDRFTLCGYEFSLKGTQAKLMAIPSYRDILQKAGR